MKTNNVKSIYLLLTLIVISVCGVALSHFGPANFDTPILMWFRINGDITQLAGPSWMPDFWLVVTWSGDKIPRLVSASLLILGLVLVHQKRSAMFAAVVLFSGIVLTGLLKYLIARPRPQIVTHFDHASSYSFPSGHALNSTLFFLTVAWVLVPLIPSKIARWSLSLSAVMLSLVVGTSRIALGVHWPSDVLASWLIATIWLCLWVMLAKYVWRNEQD